MLPGKFTRHKSSVSIQQKPWFKRLFINRWQGGSSNAWGDDSSRYKTTGGSMKTRAPGCLECFLGMKSYPVISWGSLVVDIPWFTMGFKNIPSERWLALGFLKHQQVGGGFWNIYLIFTLILGGIFQFDLRVRFNWIETRNLENVSAKSTPRLDL